MCGCACVYVWGDLMYIKIKPEPLTSSLTPLLLCFHHEAASIGCTILMRHWFSFTRPVCRSPYKGRRIRHISFCAHLCCFRVSCLFCLRCALATFHVGAGQLCSCSDFGFVQSFVASFARLIFLAAGQGWMMPMCHPYFTPSLLSPSFCVGCG